MKKSRFLINSETRFSFYQYKDTQNERKDSATSEDSIILVSDIFNKRLFRLGWL